MEEGAEVGQLDADSGYRWVIIARRFTSTRPIGSNPCVKEVYMYASPTSILKFKAYLPMVPEFSAKAASSKSKSDLLK